MNKSFSSETANRYALALYELANENSELEAVEKNVSELLSIYNTSEDFKNFIKNPTQTQSIQLEILNKISIQMNLSKFGLKQMFQNQIDGLYGPIVKKKHGLKK